MPAQNTIKKLFNLLIQFLEKKPSHISDEIRQNSTLLHYYLEIIRYFNKINFILNHTLNALGVKRSLAKSEISIYLYLVYRTIWEQESFTKLWDEIRSFSSKKSPSLSKRTLLQFHRKLSTFSWKLALKYKSALEKLSILEAIPTFLIKKLRSYMDVTFLKKNLKVMNSHQSQTLNFILNTECVENRFGISQKISNFLANYTIPFKFDNNLNSIYQIPATYKNILVNSSFYKRGEILLLDKASIYTANLIAPANNHLICDLCAAPGMKSSVILQNLKGFSRIIASEFNKERTYTMNSLLHHFNSAKVSVLNSDGIDFPKRKYVLFDKILLDAPCTGSGAFSSNPELKWRQNRRFLHQNMVFQEKLFRSALLMLKSGGILVYCTCSLYPQEGELQILKFLDQLIPLDLPKYISSSYKINDKIVPGTGRLFPAIHGTKGFFIGKFKKK